MQLVKLFYYIRDNGCKVSRYLRRKDRVRILRAHKLGFFVSNLADCFNVNESKKPITGTACGSRKPITMNNENNLIDILPPKKQQRTVSKAPFCNKTGRFTEVFILPSAKRDEEIWMFPKCHLILGWHWTSNFAQKLKSCGASFWRCFFTNECICCDESVKTHKKSFVERISSEDLFHQSKKNLASIKFLQLGRNKTWTILSLDLHQRVGWTARNLSMWCWWTCSRSSTNTFLLGE